MTLQKNYDNIHTSKYKDTKITTKRECKEERYTQELVILIVAIATIYDIAIYRVPNYVFIVGWIVALIYNIVRHGSIGVVEWAAGCVVPVVVLSILFIFRVIGGADVKAFSVIGGFVLYKGVIKIIVISFIIGAVISLIKMLFCRNLLARLRYFFSYFKNFFYYKKIEKYYDNTCSKDMVIHFMIPIFIGTILYFYS